MNLMYMIIKIKYLIKIMEGNEQLNKLNEDEEIKLFNEYSKLSRDELKNIITKKNQELILLNEQKEKSMKSLNLIVENLNKIIANNSDILYKIEPDPYIIKQLEKIIDLRKRDLNSSKKINNTFKLQYEKMSNRVENLFSPRKINIFETQINYLKKENYNINCKIRILKENNILNIKKIENLKNKKKYSEKIKSFTEEIKSLESKKLDYYTKLNSNKRSLENILKEKEILYKLYNSNINKELDEGILSKINYWLNIIKSDLEGTEEEIIQRIESDNSRIINEIDKNLIKNNNKNTLYIPNEKINLERAKSSNPNNKNKINNFYQGIFTKYSLLQQKSNYKSQPRYMLNKNNKENDIVNNKIEDLNVDYELTSNDDYNELLNKKKEYVEMINRLEKTMKEVNKITNIKTENIFYSVNDNSKKLNNLKQQNQLIQNEINNLEKVYQLTFEQFEINKELKTKEIYNENDKKNNENEKKKENNENKNSKSKENDNENQNIDLENLNNDINEQNKININQKNNESKKEISDEDNNNIKNDTIEIPKFEKIKEEDIPSIKKKKNLNREKRLEEIKLKYLEMENEEKRMKKEEITKNNEENIINEEEFEGIVEEHVNEEDENNEENENNGCENNEEEDDNNEDENNEEEDENN